MNLTQKIILFSVVCIAIIGLIYYAMTRKSPGPVFPLAELPNGATVELPTGTKVLYVDNATKINASVLSEDPLPAGKSFNVYTENIPGSSKYTICRNIETPSRYRISSTDKCRDGWKDDSHFYAFSTPQPNTRPVCLGAAPIPARGKMGIDEKDCTGNGWIHSKVIYTPM